MLDMGGAANLVLGPRAIFALGAEVRSRLNGHFFALFFAGGALVSALGGWAYAGYGWEGHLALCAALPASVLVYQADEFMRRPVSGPSVQTSASR
jgi:hypothetical protein